MPNLEVSCVDCGTELLRCSACGKTICDSCSFDGKCKECTDYIGDSDE